MTHNEFIVEYTGETVGYPEGQYVGECLSLVKVYMQKVYGFKPPASGSNSAHGYWYNFPNPLSKYFTKIENTATNAPDIGDIPIWNEKVGNGYGHIDICTKKGTIKQFTGLDQNWNGKQAHTVIHNYNNVLGWLHPIKEVVPPMSTNEVDALLAKYGKGSVSDLDAMIEQDRTEKKEYVQTITDQKALIEEEQKKSEGLQKEIKEYTEQLAINLNCDATKEAVLAKSKTIGVQVDTLQDLYATLEKKTRKEKEDYESALTDAKTEIDRLQKALEALKIRVEELEAHQHEQQTDTPENKLKKLLESFLQWFKGK